MRWVAALTAAVWITGCGPGPAEIAARQAVEARYAAAERAFERRLDDTAFAAFAEIAADEAFDRPTRALARHRQGVIRLRQGRSAEARALLDDVGAFGIDERTALAALDRPLADRAARRAGLVEVADAWPRTGAAEIAVERLTDDTRHDEVGATVDALTGLVARHPETSLGPVASARMAHVQWRIAGDAPAARATLQRLTRQWPDAQETDEALWMLGGLERRRGAWHRAARAYLALADRYRSRGCIPMGSERAPRADDAALWAGRVILHGMGDAIYAIDVLEDAIDDFGDGMIADDAHRALAIAQFAAERPADARATLKALLAEHPGSRWAVEAKAILDGAEPPRPDPRRVEAPEA